MEDLADMQSQPPVDDLDPDTAVTLEDFTAMLRRLHVRAGKPSYRRLERWALRERPHGAATALARATISDTLLGKRAPRKEFVAAFVEACGVAGQSTARWLGAWERVNEAHHLPGPRREFGATAARRHAELQRRYDDLESRLAAVTEAEGASHDERDRLRSQVDLLSARLRTQTALLDRCFALADSLDRQGKLVEATTAYAICADARRASLGDADPATIEARRALAFAAERAGDLAVAATEMRAIVAVLADRWGPDHPSTLEVRHGLAWVVGRLGDWAAAEEDLGAVLTARRVHLGDDHPAVLDTRNSLAWVQGRLGRWDRAYAELTEVAAARERMLGDDHPATLDTWHLLAWAEGRRGNLAAAKGDFERLLDRRRAVLGDDHPDTLNTEQALAWVQQKLGDLAGAQARYEEMLDTQRRVLGENHPQIALIRQSMLRLGIDYGSFRTTAVLRFPDGRYHTLLFDGRSQLTSAVYLAEDGAFVVGADAQRRGLDDPGRLEPMPQRRIDDGVVVLGGTEVPVDELIAATIRRVVTEATRQAGVPVGSVVLTHPGSWGESRRGMLSQAAIAAGLHDPVLLPAPVAAARFHAALPEEPIRPGDLYVVYDLGAASFEVSLVRADPDGWSVVASDGLSDFGAGDLDTVIVDLIGAQLPTDASDGGGGPTARETWRRLTNPATGDDHRLAQRLWQAVRDTKATLSGQSSAEITVPGIDMRVYLSRGEFEAVAEPLLRRTVDMTVALVERAHASSGALSGLLVAGGGGRIPLVSTLLHRALGTVPQVHDRLDIMVAEGSVRDDAHLPASFTP